MKFQKILVTMGVFMIFVGLLPMIVWGYDYPLVIVVGFFTAYFGAVLWFKGLIYPQLPFSVRIVLYFVLALITSVFGIRAYYFAMERIGEVSNQSAMGFFIINCLICLMGIAIILDVSPGVKKLQEKQEE